MLVFSKKNTKSKSHKKVSFLNFNHYFLRSPRQFNRFTLKSRGQ